MGYCVRQADMSNIMIRSTMGLLLMTVVAAGCGDKPQEIGQSSVRKADSKAWDMAKSSSVAEGWKAGDQISWEEQMRKRAQGQDEKSRITAVATAAPTKTP